MIALYYFPTTTLSEPSYKNCSPTGKALSEKDLQFCLRKTKFNRKTILFWFKSFRKECPSGKLSREHLYGIGKDSKTILVFSLILELFTKIFPCGNAETFCDHIFRLFDSDGNNFLDFKEFLMALDIAQCTDERQKLEWSFRLLSTVPRSSFYEFFTYFKDVGCWWQWLYKPDRDDQHHRHHGWCWGGGAGAQAWSTVLSPQRQDESQGDIWSSGCWWRWRTNQDWVCRGISYVDEIKQFTPMQLIVKPSWSCRVFNNSPILSCSRSGWKWVITTAEPL